MLLRVNDAARIQRVNFGTVKKAETQYGIQLRKVARHVGSLIEHIKGPELQRALRDYSLLLRPWAASVGAAMIEDIKRRDERVWTAMGRTISRELRREISEAPTGQLLTSLLSEQVRLITSLPVEAGERAQKLALEAVIGGRRAEDIRKEIEASGEVTESRATLIARTEVARVSSGLMQARATYIGSEGYIWRTAQDKQVRPSHRKMSAKFVRWDKPPVLDNLTGHAGQLPNCRCYPEPVIPQTLH